MYITSGNNACKEHINTDIRACRNDLTYGVCGCSSAKPMIKASSHKKTKRVRIKNEDAQMLAAAELAIQKKYARRRFMYISAVVALIALTTLTYTGILQRNAAILELNYANVRLEGEIKQISAESGEIREEFVKTVDPVKLRQTAIDELGMREPAAVQMLSVSVPNGDRVIYDATSPEKAKSEDLYSNLFEDLEGFFKTMR